MEDTADSLQNFVFPSQKLGLRNEAHYLNLTAKSDRFSNFKVFGALAFCANIQKFFSNPLYNLGFRPSFRNGDQAGFLP